MSVYKDAYRAVNKIQNQQERVFEDACDVGVPVCKGDEFWNYIKELKDYHNPKTDPKIERTENDNTIIFSLLDEWAYSDGRKTADECEDIFKMTYTKLDCWRNKPYLMSSFKEADGFVNIFKIN